MNPPSITKGHHPYYRSQVSPLTSNKPPLQNKQKPNYFKQSLVPDLKEKYREMERVKMSRNLGAREEGLCSQRSQVKGYEHLLSPRTRNTPRSPSNTYRTIAGENIGPHLSPRSPRDNIYTNDNTHELEENRSVKFITRLREEINSPLGQRGINNNNQHVLGSGNSKGKSKGHEGGYEGESGGKCGGEDEEECEGQKGSCEGVELQESRRRQSFEQRLIEKCKSLQHQLQTKAQQLHNLTSKLHTLQQKHLAQQKHLQTELSLSQSKHHTQLQITTAQLQQLQKTLKNTQKSRHAREKALIQEVNRYAKDVKQREQEKNKMVLEFEQVLRERLEAKERVVVDQGKESVRRWQEENRGMRMEIKELKETMDQVRQEKEDIFQQSKLLNTELQNYTRWNNELSTQVRHLQRKLHQQQSSNKLLLATNHSLQSTIQQHQSTITHLQHTLTTLQSTTSHLSQQLQIYRFECQSLRNEMQCKQSEFSNEKSLYLQQIEILQSKLLCANQEKAEICRQVEYHKNELKNMRRLVDNLEERLEEQRREAEEGGVMRGRLEGEVKEGRARVRELEGEKEKWEGRVKEVEEQVDRLRGYQREWGRQQQRYKQQAQQQDDEQQQQQQSSTTQQQQCLQRIQHLQHQLTATITTHTQQKHLLTTQHTSTVQSLKKRLIQQQNLLFLRQQSLIDDKRRSNLQLTRLQQRITLLQTQLSEKVQQVKRCQQEANVSEIRVKHMARKLQEGEEMWERKVREKEEEGREVRRVKGEEKESERRVLVGWVETVLGQVERVVGRGGGGGSQEGKGGFIKRERGGSNMKQNQYQQNQLQQQQQQNQNIPSFVSLCLNPHSPSKPQQHHQTTPIIHQSPPKQKVPIPIPSSPSPFLSLLLQPFNQAHLSHLILTRTRALTSHITLMTKKLSIYQHKILELQSQLSSLPIKIHQEYLQKVTELERKVEQQENQLERARVEKQTRDKGEKEIETEREKLLGLEREVERVKRVLVEKEKEVEDMVREVDRGRKLKEQAEETIEEKDKEHKRVVKKLSTEIEEYKTETDRLKAEIEMIQSQNQSLLSQLSQLNQLNQLSQLSQLNQLHQLNQLEAFQQAQQHHNNIQAHHNNITSMTTVNHQYPTFLTYPLTTPPRTPSKFHPTHSSSFPTNPSSLQQLVEFRLKQLTLQNEHLSSQLSSVNSELMKEREMFIQMNYVVKGLQEEMGRVGEENYRLKEQGERQQETVTHMAGELSFLQQHNQQLQHELALLSGQLSTAQSQLSLLQQSALLMEKQKLSLQQQIDQLHKKQAEAYIEAKKLKEEIDMKQKKIIQNDQEKLMETQRVKKVIRESEAKKCQEETKRAKLEGVVKEVVDWVKKLFGEGHSSIQHSSTPHDPITPPPHPQSPLLPPTFPSHQPFLTSLTQQLATLHHTLFQHQTTLSTLHHQSTHLQQLLQQSHQQLTKKQRQLQMTRDKVTSLERVVKRLEIEVEEWRFISESSCLNRSLEMGGRVGRSDGGTGFAKTPTSTAYRHHHAQKGTTSSFHSHSHTKEPKPLNTHPISPLKSPPKLSPYHHQPQNPPPSNRPPQHLSPSSSNNSNSMPQYVSNNNNKQCFGNGMKMQSNSSQQNSQNLRDLQNSVQSISSVGQFYDYQKGNNLGSSEGEMSFF